MFVVSLVSYSLLLSHLNFVASSVTEIEVQVAQ
jgi:hypothetical protein